MKRQRVQGLAPNLVWTYEDRGPGNSHGQSSPAVEYEILSRHDDNDRQG
jgi:hypothetical protein